MKYLVTGGNGFLGRATCEVLLQQGHDVSVFDNFSRTDGVNQIDQSEIKVIDGDIRDKDALKKAAGGAESIIHLAFINGTEYFYSKPGEVVEVGIKGMLNVSETAAECGIEEVVLFSSSEVYQNPRIIPTPEEIELVIPDVFNPRYSYGGAKIASELILVNLCDTFLTNWKIIRPHNVYGPKMGLQHVIPALIEKAFVKSKELIIQGDGSQTRAFCHVEDFKSALSLVLHDPTVKQIYNIGVDEEVKIHDLAKMVIKKVGNGQTIKTTIGNDGETSRRCPNISKLQKLGFKSQVSLEQGLDDLISKHRE
jgi:UDP-glucose 4-epimerase